MTKITSLSRFTRRSIRNLCVLVAVTACALMMSPGARAQTYTVLHNFCSQIKCADGNNPQAVLIQATNGFLYGTAATDGSNHGGSIFKITPSGSFTPLYEFPNDFFPQEVVQATNGNLYGTSFIGADQSGSIYTLAQGALTTLYSFCSKTDCADGGTPNPLVQAVNGYFYGTTEVGGAHDTGTLFKISPTGKLTTLYSFCSLGGASCTDGSYPTSALIQTSSGDLYGTTEGGGGGVGTIFKVTSGVLTTVYSFLDDSSPEAALLQANNGNLYGTTYDGGTNGGGTIFAMTPSGTVTTLYSFCSQPNCADGSQPVGALIQATDGNFYGATNSGGANMGGTVFKITPAGVLTTLYSLCSQANCTDGEFPQAGLMQATNGRFYGTASTGGACASHKCGTVFAVDVGLGPFIALQSSAGSVGATVRILGTNLTGASSVTFNGISATFKVNSTGSSITTTVPVGATTGVVQVVTPGTTLNSNVVYTVK